MLLWFRDHDIRIHDNAAFHYFLQHAQPQDKAIYFTMPKVWRGYDWAAIKIDFLRRHLALLRSQLANFGVELLVIDVDSYQQQIDYISQYYCQHDIKCIVTNREFELNELQRDQALLSQGLKFKFFESDVIVPKGKLLNQSGQMFKVFTPFKKAWLSYVRENGFEYYAQEQRQAEDTEIADEQANRVSNAWPLVNVIEQQVLADFFQNKLAHYHQQRDLPAIKGTSGLSPYLAIGALSSRYVLQLLLQRYPDLLVASDSPVFSWLNELIWREFYRHLLFHYPQLAMQQNFNRRYDGLKWHNDKLLFQAWCDGKTGYPLIDAAMRQLLKTGWMHNRLRMVVASFLTKHLLIDWRWGEQFFMSHLIDGDLAANNGGWQWAASTGCDAQPYFRIFNPIRQSERFDPQGEFIRRYLPELEHVPEKHIHFPHQYLADKAHHYWPAIVEHKSARERALSFFKAHG
ncbi:deoxyribodipyrimidine photo-lyase [Thalassotalea insulae]|uniref:Deoxyribodipyrimidine photo-lyase n=1 Tax=Thalassotalea insulae TaxID=2056778 RepID=A0ABQ6GV47_9GAMM|nr:FAD-binding domain-containing protein [Thalassotalea insulae]GLX79803.1 deoxyribodipyrimidine photo-lyase [Thalassotalea insulae]